MKGIGVEWSDGISSELRTLIRFHSTRYDVTRYEMEDDEWEYWYCVSH